MAAMAGILGVEPEAARARAAEHFQEAEQAFEKGHYRDAIREFEAAYRLAPHPDLLFDLGQCHERLGDLVEAIERYRAYLEAVPDAEDADLVSVSISDLEDRLPARGLGLASSAAAPSDAPLAVAVTVSAPRRRVWTWVLAGVAGAGLATGVGLGVGAQAARDEMVREQHGTVEVQRLHDAALGQATGANIAYGAAGVAAVTAIILFILEPREPLRVTE